MASAARGAIASRCLSGAAAAAPLTQGTVSSEKGCMRGSPDSRVLQGKLPNDLTWIMRGGLADVA